MTLSSATPLFALLDANNFYCRCEQVMNPRLEGKPLVVLSNNDGCVVSRSQEAKSLGVGMGQPWFELRDLAASQGLIGLSSNYSLYADMSARMVEALRLLSPRVEVYSIDECFMDLTDLGGCDITAIDGIVRQARGTVRKWTGLTNCVGVGPSKTLAKIANRLAKREPDMNGVCLLLDQESRTRYLPRIPAGDVWGIGPASATKLAALGVITADDLRATDRSLARKVLGVTGQRVVDELNGCSCLSLEEAPPSRKGLAVTRTFGALASAWEDIAQALTTYASRAAEKLRGELLAAAYIRVFLTADPHTGSWHSAAAGTLLPCPSADSRVIVATALAIGRGLWRPGRDYRRAGVMLENLVPADQAGPTLFSTPDNPRSKALMAAIDGLNRRHGRNTVRLATAGVPGRQPWTTAARHRSPRYTTRWDEIPTAEA